MKNGKEISNNVELGHQEIIFLGFSPDGKKLISVGSEGKIKIWEVK